jgi:hypothetical protein
MNNLPSISFAPSVVVLTDPWDFITQQARKYNEQQSSHIFALFSVRITAFLSMHDLLTVSCISKNWKVVAYAAWQAIDIEKVIPLKIFDGDYWNRCFNLVNFDFDLSGSFVPNKRVTISSIMLAARKLSERNIKFESAVMVRIPNGLTSDVFNSLECKQGVGYDDDFNTFFYSVLSVLQCSREECPGWRCNISASQPLAAYLDAPSPRAQST